MFHFVKISGLCLGLVIMLQSSAAAAITFTLGQIGDSNVNVPTGMTAQFGVFASSDAGDTLNAFNLPIDFGINGHDGPLLPLGVLDLPAGFAFNSVVADPGLGGAVNITGDAALPPIFTQNYDGVFNSSGLSLALGTGQTRLFDVLIDVTAAPGAVLPIAITDDVGPPTNPTVSGPFSVTLNGDPALNAGDVGYSLNAGSITVTAVPEPASWTVIGVALCGGALSRRRRKRAAGGRTK